MENNEGQDVQQTSQPVSPRLPRSYNFLIQLSRRMGTVATKSSIVHDVRSFMNQEISLSPSEKVFGNTLPKLTMSKTQEKKPQDDEAAERQEAQQKAEDLKKIVSQSHEVLMSANTVFPITLFPHTITIDRTKVTITRRDFFWTSDVLSIRVEDVLNVEATVGPLFGALNITGRISGLDHFKIAHLWRNDALRMKHVIQGYVIAQHNNIDTSHLSRSDLVETLRELGHDTNR